MNTTQLPISPVRFVEDRAQDIHQYWMGFAQLSGVTEILKQVLFYDKYNGIDADVLARAAARGTAIHEAVQAWLLQESWTPAEDLIEYDYEARAAVMAWGNSEATNYLLNSARPISCEYLVSNEEDIATKIDIVFEEADGDDITDIKTTAELDMEYVGWQLSVEKVLYQSQTGRKVKRLLVLWYNRGLSLWEVHEVKDKGEEAVASLISDWRAGVRREVSKVITDYPAPVVQLGNLYLALELEIKRLEAQREDFRSRLKALMNENDIKTLKLEGFTCSVVAPSERRTLDSKRLVAEHPELKTILDGYYKVSTVTESLKITL